MSELAERIVRELEDSEELSFACPTSTLDWLRERIEQALLAERRLARTDTWEEAAKIADIICGATWTAYKMGPQRGDLHLQGESDGAALVSKELRAAAEKAIRSK